MPEEKKEAPVQTVEQLKQEQMNKLNEQYKALVKRLETEPNIILRYEIKLNLDMLAQVYQLLFGGNQ